MKAIVSVLVLVVVMASARSITIENYPVVGCTGIPKPATLPINTCLKGDDNGEYKSLEFNLQPDVTFARIYPDATANCSSRGEPVAVTCGKCIDTKVPGIGFYMYKCNMRAKYVIVSDQCDSTCSTCKMTEKFTAGSCHSYNHGTRWLELDSIFKGAAVIEKLDMNTTTCTGVPITETLACGQCYRTAKFNCTDSADESTPLSTAFIRPVKMH
jgi:hypothetical protein